MSRKYFYLIILLNLIVNVQSQALDDDYEDYDAGQTTRTGN